MLDLKILNGQVFIPGSGIHELDIGIQNGTVTVLAERGSIDSATRTIDAEGNIVMPGAIDPHIHLGIFNDFALECETETRAALAGGITSVGCFLGGADSYLSQLGPFIETIDHKSSTDIMFHLSIFSDEQMAQMDACRKQFGVTSFKFYMAGVKGVFPGVSDGFIHKGFNQVAQMGERAIACVHCEDQSILDIAYDQTADQTPDGTLSDWANTAPDMAEEEAIIRAYYLAEKAGNRLYIVHISTADGIKRFAQLKREGTAKAFGETTSAYLSLNKNGDYGLLGKMVPPLRDREDMNTLWSFVANDTLSTFGTDNVSMTKEVKQAQKGMLGAMPGYPILQTHMPAILTHGYHNRNIPLESILTKFTSNPARIFGLYPKKGTIMVGSDADIVILDLEKERVVRSDSLYSYSDFSLYEGMTLKGWPRIVVKGGKVAFENDEIVSEPGIGNYLRRTL